MIHSQQKNSNQCRKPVQAALHAEADYNEMIIKIIIPASMNFSRNLALPFFYLRGFAKPSEY